MNVRLSALLLALGGFAVLMRIASEAWVGEDAYITFRVVENFVDGYGLRWNVDERVQVYTHPLWLLLVAAPFAVTREIPWTVTAVSLLLFVGAYGLLAARLARRPWVLLGAFAVPFLGIESLVLYATSGFESPLTFFLLTGFAVTLLRENVSEPTRWGRLALWAALGAVTRLDSVLLFGPPLLFLGVTQWRRVAWRRLFLGGAPLIAWLLFSLFYYGSPFPNTARAKVSPDVPLADYVREGVLYTSNLVLWDPGAAVVLVLALAAAAAALRRWLGEHSDTRAGCIAALGSGILLQGAYVLRIGGGFLSGRFWAPALFVALLVLCFAVEHALQHGRRIRLRSLAVIAAGLAGILLGVHALALRVDTWEKRSPIQELPSARTELQADGTWAMTRAAELRRARGLQNRRAAEAAEGRYVIVRGPIGFYGMAAGRGVTLIDWNALSDPLLVRLPLADPQRWRIGHLRRVVPKGYVHARQTDELDQMDPALQEYYRRLRLVVSGPLLGWERMRTIVAFRLGRYDGLLDEWRSRAKRPSAQRGSRRSGSFVTARNTGLGWSGSGSASMRSK